MGRALAVNAATKPSAVATGAGVAVAGLLLGQPWLIALAAVVYVALAVLTFFDAKEADHVAARLRGGEGETAAAGADRVVARLDPNTLAPRIGRWLERARVEERRIRQAIEESDLDLDDLSAEVDGLVVALDTIAGRAQRLAEYQATTDRQEVTARRSRAAAEVGSGTAASQPLVDALDAQIATLERMDGQLTRFDIEMEHVVTTLSLLRGQVVEMGVETAGLGEEKLAERARSLREQVGAASSAMAELASHDTP